MSKFLRIKGWESFQHYKDRNPTWIKLHKSLLDNFEYQSLPLASRALAPMLWLLASEYPDISKGLIEYNFKKIAFRLHTTEREVEDAVRPLIANGFLELCKDASGTLAEPEQVDSPETYREEDIEKRKNEREARAFSEFWEIFPKQRIGNQEKAEKAYRKALTRATPEQIHKGLLAYAGSAEVSGGFAKGAAAWLNDDRWTSDYSKGKTNALNPNNGSKPSKPDRARAAIFEGTGLEGLATGPGPAS